MLQQQEQQHQGKDDPGPDGAEPGGEGNAQKAPQDAAGKEVSAVGPQLGEGSKLHGVGVGRQEHMPQRAHEDREQTHTPEPQDHRLLPAEEEDPGGHDQGEDVSNLLKSAGFTNVWVKKDLAGLDRVVVGMYNIDNCEH